MPKVRIDQVEKVGWPWNRVEVDVLSVGWGSIEGEGTGSCERFKAASGACDGQCHAAELEMCEGQVGAEGGVMK